MKERIQEFTYINNPSFSTEENLRVKNRSNHQDVIHQAIFNLIDEFSKTVVKDIHNVHSEKIFKENQLNLVSDESTIEQVIISSLKSHGYNSHKLDNPELIYRAFNFVKPGTLLPRFNSKLYLIKQKGISESGVEKNYVINPYFFAFKISLDIYVTCLFCSDYSEDLEEGLLKILSDKYGDDFLSIYKYVAYTSENAIQIGRDNGDKNDETFIEQVKAISGINDHEIFNNFVYESAMISASNKLKAFKK